MRTSEFAAVGLAAAAVMTLAGAARAQGMTPPNEGRVLPRNIPPADQPLIRRLPEPSISIEGGFGVLGYLTGAAATGPTWNVRVTGTLSPRLAVEGNYLGAVNERAQVKRSLVLTSFDAGLRYNFLRADEAPVQVFAVGGLGYAGWAGQGGDMFAIAVPFSAGAERLLTRNIKLGARLNLRPTFFDDLSLPGGRRVGGDSWSLLAYGGGAF